MELTEQDIHNIGMNRVGKELEQLGYEFLGVNSDAKKHPQFVTYKKGEGTTFIMVKTTVNPNNAWQKNEALIQKLENHAEQKNASLWYAGVQISPVEEGKQKLLKEDEIVVQFNGFEVILDHKETKS